MKTPIGISGAAVALSLLTIAPDAAAFDFGTPANKTESAQNFAFELRFSPYRPQIDDEPGLTGAPFTQTFGSARRLLIQLELDWQMLRIPHVGTLGPGVAVGYTTMSADSKTLSGKESGDETFLSIYPFHLSGVLRADAVWREARIPLIPYAKLGVGYAHWRAGNSGGTSKVKDAAGNVIASGRGNSVGSNAALGVELVLEALDRGSVRNLDSATGINHAYVFAEYYLLTLNGFGAGDSLRVGTKSWAMGLTFEF
ncbi:MAG: hypothetical protein KC657_18665 [Myxococcales bacterium]|nr:hypothetical protein [Myxococcales bacterium]